MSQRPPRKFSYYEKRTETGSRFKVTLLIEAGVKDMTHLVDFAVFRDEEELRAHLARVTGDPIEEVRREGSPPRI